MSDTESTTLVATQEDLAVALPLPLASYALMARAAYDAHLPDGTSPINAATECIPGFHGSYGEDENADGDVIAGLKNEGGVRISARGAPRDAARRR